METQREFKVGDRVQVVGCGSMDGRIGEVTSLREFKGHGVVARIEMEDTCEGTDINTDRLKAAPEKPSARPDWLTDEMMAEMRRLEGTSESEGAQIQRSFWTLNTADFDAHDDDQSKWFVNCAEDDGACWLTPAGHKAVAAIEAEESIDPALLTGEALDRFGAMTGCAREPGETDSSFRKRQAQVLVDATQGDLRCECGARQADDEGASPDAGTFEEDGQTKYVCGGCWLRNQYAQGDRESSAPKIMKFDSSQPDGFKDVLSSAPVELDTVSPAHLAEGERKDGHTTGRFFVDSDGDIDQEARAAYLAVKSGIELPLVEVTVSVIKCVSCNDSGYIPGLATPLVPCPRCGR